MVQVQQSLPRRRLVPLQYGQPITKLVNAQRDMREIETVDAIGNLHYTALLNSVTISVSTHGLRVPKRIRKKDPILNEYIKATIHFLETQGEEEDWDEEEEEEEDEYGGTPGSPPTPRPAGHPNSRFTPPPAGDEEGATIPSHATDAVDSLSEREGLEDSLSQISMPVDTGTFQSQPANSGWGRWVQTLKRTFGLLGPEHDGPETSGDEQIASADAIISPTIATPTRTRSAPVTPERTPRRDGSVSPSSLEHSPTSFPPPRRRRASASPTASKTAPPRLAQWPPAAKVTFDEAIAQAQSRKRAQEEGRRTAAQEEEEEHLRLAEESSRLERIKAVIETRVQKKPKYRFAPRETPSTPSPVRQAARAPVQHQYDEPMGADSPTHAAKLSVADLTAIVIDNTPTVFGRLFNFASGSGSSSSSSSAPPEPPKPKPKLTPARRPRSKMNTPPRRPAIISRANTLTHARPPVSRRPAGAVPSPAPPLVRAHTTPWSTALRGPLARELESGSESEREDTPGRVLPLLGWEEEDGTSVVEELPPPEEAAEGEADDGFWESDACMEGLPEGTTSPPATPPGRPTRYNEEGDVIMTSPESTEYYDPVVPLVPEPAPRPEPELQLQHPFRNITDRSSRRASRSIFYPPLPPASLPESGTEATPTAHPPQPPVAHPLPFETPSPTPAPTEGSTESAEQAERTALQSFRFPAHSAGSRPSEVGPLRYERPRSTSKPYERPSSRVGHRRTRSVTDPVHALVRRRAGTPQATEPAPALVPVPVSTPLLSAQVEAVDMSEPVAVAETVLSTRATPASGVEAEGLPTVSLVNAVPDTYPVRVTDAVVTTVTLTDENTSTEQPTATMDELLDQLAESLAAEAGAAAPEPPRTRWRSRSRDRSPSPSARRALANIQPRPVARLRHPRGTPPSPVVFPVTAAGIRINFTEATPERELEEMEVLKVLGVLEFVEEVGTQDVEVPLVESPEVVDLTEIEPEVGNVEDGEPTVIEPAEVFDPTDFEPLEVDEVAEPVENIEFAEPAEVVEVAETIDMEVAENIKVETIDAIDVDQSSEPATPEPTKPTPVPQPSRRNKRRASEEDPPSSPPPRSRARTSPPVEVKLEPEEPEEVEASIPAPPAGRPHRTRSTAAQVAPLPVRQRSTRIRATSTKVVPVPMPMPESEVQPEVKHEAEAAPEPAVQPTNAEAPQLRTSQVPSPEKSACRASTRKSAPLASTRASTPVARTARTRSTSAAQAKSKTEEVKAAAKKAAVKTTTTKATSKAKRATISEISEEAATATAAGSDSGAAPSSPPASAGEISAIKTAPPKKTAPKKPASKKATATTTAGNANPAEVAEVSVPRTQPNDIKPSKAQLKKNAIKATEQVATRRSTRSRR